jgi:hypothetical protein
MSSDTDTHNAGRPEDPPPDALPDDQRTGDEPNPSGQPEKPQRAWDAHPTGLVSRKDGHVTLTRSPAVILESLSRFNYSM